MKVSVYYNLHKHCLSVRSNEGDSYGRVIQHRDIIILKDVKFIVNEAGRKRVLKEKKKNVHAFVRGTIWDTVAKLGTREVKVTYNPYKYNSFIELESKNPIYSAEYVIINGKHITAYIDTKGIL